MCPLLLTSYCQSSHFAPCRYIKKSKKVRVNQSVLSRIFVQCPNILRVDLLFPEFVWTMNQASSQWRGAITRLNRSRLNPQSVVGAVRPADQTMARKWQKSERAREGRLRSVITDTDYTQPSSEHWELPLIIYPATLSRLVTEFLSLKYLVLFQNS